MKNSHVLPTFGLLFGAVCWGIIWYPYRLLDDVGITGIVASFYTYSIAVVCAGLLSITYWRQLFKVPKSILWLGIVAGWTNISYVLAIIEGEVMRVMLLFYLSPIWTLLLAHFWLKEQTHTTGYIAIVVSLIGAAIMLYDPSISPLPLPQNQAEWLAVSAGLGFSLTNVITRKSTHLSVRAKSFAVWLGVVAVAFVLVLILPVPVITPMAFSFHSWVLMGMIALFLLAATILVQYGVTQMTAVRASILFMFELVVAAIAAYYLAHELMTIQEWIGGAMIVAAAIFASLNHTDKIQ